MWTCLSPGATGDIWVLQKLLRIRHNCSLHICPPSIPTPRATEGLEPARRRRKGSGSSAHCRGSAWKELLCFPYFPCRAGKSPSSQLLFVTCPYEIVSVGATLQCSTAARVMSRARHHCCSMETNLFFSRQFNCPTSSVNSRALLLHWYLKSVAAISGLKCGLYVQKCVSSSSSINVTEETVSSWNFSHFHSQTTTAPGVPLLSIFWPFFLFSWFFQGISCFKESCNSIRSNFILKSKPSLICPASLLEEEPFSRFSSRDPIQQPPQRYFIIHFVYFMSNLMCMKEMNKQGSTHQFLEMPVM